MRRKFFDAPKGTKWARQILWRKMILSEWGPRSTVRLVLMSLHARMDYLGLAWPSIRTITRDSGLCQKTVSKALTEAVSEKWLRRELMPANDGSWANYKYQSRFPKSVLDVLTEAERDNAKAA